MNSPVYVNTDLRGKEWRNAGIVARNLQYAYVRYNGMLGGTEYGKIIHYLSRHPGLMKRVTKILQRGAV